MTDRVIRQITDHFASRLPEGVPHYHIEDLKYEGFPDFLISRIHIELQWNLDESMMLPETDWANTQSEAVQRSWQQFLNAIHAEAKLPASYARAVIETAVADILEMLTEPRKNIPEIIFGGEDVLTAEELNERSELLVVYPHFSKVLAGYMRRKIQDKITRSRCKKIVAQVDDKITRQYTPLQWAQMLDPLFALGDSRVSTDLLRMFFEDREMNRTAGKFDAMNETITRAEFVEVLSEPELWDREDHQEDMSDDPDESNEKEPIDLEKHTNLDDIGLVYENIGEIHQDLPASRKPGPEDQKTSKSREKMSRPGKKNRQAKEKVEVQVESDADKEEEAGNEDLLSEVSGQDEPVDHRSKIEDQLKEKKEKKPEIDSKPQASAENIQGRQVDEEPDDSGSAEFKPGAKDWDENDEDRETESEAGQQGQPHSLNAFFANSEEDEGAEDISGLYYSSDLQGTENEMPIVPNKKETAAQPIWMRFRNDNDSSKEESGEIMPRFVEIEDEQGRWSENLARESHKKQTANADFHLKDLKERLKKERGYFVDELFNGSREAYEASLEKIAREATWKKASKLIEEDIFRRNNVNIFSAVAVNFIDRLQNFFLEKQNRN